MPNTFDGDMTMKNIVRAVMNTDEERREEEAAQPEYFRQRREMNRALALSGPLGMADFANQRELQESVGLKAVELLARHRATRDAVAALRRIAEANPTSAVREAAHVRLSQWDRATLRIAQAIGKAVEEVRASVRAWESTTIVLPQTLAASGSEDFRIPLALPETITGRLIHEEDGWYAELETTDPEAISGETVLQFSEATASGPEDRAISLAWTVTGEARRAEAFLTARLADGEPVTFVQVAV